MKKILFLWSVCAMMATGCHGSPQSDAKHADEEEPKFYYTTYSNQYELFAESEPLVANETANMLLFITQLPQHKPFEGDSVTLRFIVNGEDTGGVSGNWIQKGVYRFQLKPQSVGSGEWVCYLHSWGETTQMIISSVTVFSGHDQAHEAAEKEERHTANSIPFSKEFSWKIDFATDVPTIEPFGSIIKTTAQIQAAPGTERLITAKTEGVVSLPDTPLLEGKRVATGEMLLFISGSEPAGHNLAVQYAEAENNLQRASSEYFRAQALANERIISEKDLENSKNLYLNAQVLFDAYAKNVDRNGQQVVSPMNGYIKQLFVKNGSYVEVGAPIVTLSQNQTLSLYAEVQQKYATLLAQVTSATIRTLYNNQTYTLEALNGKILSYGKAALPNHYLVPVVLQIENNGNFIEGGFVELYLKSVTQVQALTVPSEAILEEQGTYFVYLQITPERFEKREIIIGATDGIRTEITKGLSPTDRIVTLGAIHIKLAQATGTLDAHSGHVH